MIANSIRCGNHPSAHTATAMAPPILGTTKSKPQNRHAGTREKIAGLVLGLGFIGLCGYNSGVTQGLASLERKNRAELLERPPGDDEATSETTATKTLATVHQTDISAVASAGTAPDEGNATQPPPSAEELHGVRGTVGTAGSSDYCQAYFEFGGSSEISPRDYRCADLPGTPIYDLKNVAVKANTLHVYAPGPETLKILHEWGNRLPALSYTWGGVEKKGGLVVVHEEPLDESMCPSRTPGVSFYSVPHFQENAFHLHNDNFLPISSNILSTPCLCDGAELSSCNRLDKTYVRTPSLRQKHGHTHRDFLQLFEPLFDHTQNLRKGSHGTSLAPEVAGTELHCVDHMVWGYIKPFYFDCQLDRGSTTWAWAHHALEALGLSSEPPPATIPLVPAAPPNGAQPRVIFLRRDPIAGQEKTNRFMRDLGPFRQAWAAEGIHMDDWHFRDSDSLKTMVSSLSGYDIYVGVHGAELTNVLYGNQGLVLVEVASDQWDKEIFHKVAQARRGGYIKIRTHAGSHYQVNHDTAGKSVRCALALWRRDEYRIRICNDAAPNPGPAQSYQSRPRKYKEGLAYFYDVGQS